MVIFCPQPSFWLTLQCIEKKNKSWKEGKGSTASVTLRPRPTQGASKRGKNAEQECLVSNIQRNTVPGAAQVWGRDTTAKDKNREEKSTQARDF